MDICLNWKRCHQNELWKRPRSTNPRASNVSNSCTKPPTPQNRIREIFASRKSWKFPRNSHTNVLQAISPPHVQFCQQINGKPQRWKFLVDGSSINHLLDWLITDSLRTIAVYSCWSKWNKKNHSPIFMQRTNDIWFMGSQKQKKRKTNCRRHTDTNGSQTNVVVHPTKPNTLDIFV